MLHNTSAYRCQRNFKVTKESEVRIFHSPNTKCKYYTITPITINVWSLVTRLVTTSRMWPQDWLHFTYLWIHRRRIRRTNAIRARRLYSRRSRARRTTRASLEAEHVRVVKIGRRGRTPTVAPQAYRSRRRWEKNSAVNKMVLTLDTASWSRSDRFRGLSRAVEDATVRRLLSSSHLSPRIPPFQHGRLPSPSRAALPLSSRFLTPAFAAPFFLPPCSLSWHFSSIRVIYSPATALCSGIIEYTPRIDRVALTERLPCRR